MLLGSTLAAATKGLRAIKRLHLGDGATHMLPQIAAVLRNRAPLLHIQSQQLNTII